MGAGDRVRAEKDILMMPGVKSAIIDPTSDPQTFTVTKMGIDATAPLDDFAERLDHLSRAARPRQEILSNASAI